MAGDEAGEVGTVMGRSVGDAEVSVVISETGESHVTRSVQEDSFALRIENQLEGREAGLPIRELLSCPRWQNGTALSSGAEALPQHK